MNMNPIAKLTANKQLLQTVGVTTAAFLVALPIGAMIMPKTAAHDAGTSSVTRTITNTSSLGSCTTDAEATSAPSSVTKTVVTPGKHTHTASHTHTQTSSNNSGSTAQVGRDGIATAVTVGDVLSNNSVLSGNNVSIPVLSNNSTNVSPETNVLSKNIGTLLDLNLVGGIL
jgi:hypothetical protein